MLTEYEVQQIDYINMKVDDFYPGYVWLVQYRIQKFKDTNNGANPSGDKLAEITIEAFKALEIGQ